MFKTLLCPLLVLFLVVPSMGAIKGTKKKQAAECANFLANIRPDKVLRSGTYNATNSIGFPIVMEFQELSDGSREERQISPQVGHGEWAPVGTAIENRQPYEKTMEQVTKPTVTRSGTYEATNSIGFQVVIEFQELSDGSREERQIDPQVGHGEWTPVGTAIKHRRPYEKVKEEAKNISVTRTGTYKATNSIRFPIVMEFQELSDGSREERQISPQVGHGEWTPVGVAIKTRRPYENVKGEVTKPTVSRSGTYKVTNLIGFQVVVEFQELSDGSREERQISPQVGHGEWTPVGTAIEKRRPYEKLAFESEKPSITRRGTYKATNLIGFQVVIEFQELSDGSREERQISPQVGRGEWTPVGMAIKTRRSYEKIY